MYNLLIVDDEVMIADYLVEVFINSDMMGDSLLSVTRATSAFEALDMIEDRHIDIILSDVSMPSMNGIALLEQVRERWRHIKVVLMSGYDDFEYVQAAMRNNSVDYVLKAEGEEQFIASVKKAIAALEQEIRNEELIQRAARSLKLANSVLIESILTDLLDGQQYEKGYLISHFADINMPLDAEQPVFIILGKANSYNAPVITHSELYKAKTLVEEYFRDNVRCASVLYERRLLWFLQPSEDSADWDRAIVQVTARLDSVQRMCADILNINISFSVAQRPVEWTKLIEAFRQLDLALVAGPSIGDGVILFNGSLCEDDCADKDAINRAYLSIKRIDTLAAYLADGNRNEFFSMFKDIMLTFKRLPARYESIKQEAIFTLTAHFLSVMNKVNNAGNRLVIKIPLETQSWDEIENYFITVATEIFEQREKDNCATTNKIFDFINKYAAEHLDEDLSLNRFAEILHYHPFYLSRIFKQVTGITFSNYIAELKMDKAKEMLANSDIKVANIAMVLGFDNASYFTRFFKKHTGLAPQEYRAKFQLIR